MVARKKITIVGAGRVGSTAAQLCAMKELGDIVLWNRTAGTAKGLALDIQEMAPIEGFDVRITGTDNWKDTKDSDVVVVTAGLPRQPGMSRDDLLLKNAAIIKEACLNVKKYSPDCILIVITNPLDAMVWYAKKVTGFPRNRVIGMAGILDTARFRSFVAMHLNVSVESVEAMVLGGHGDFMVPLPDHSTVVGAPLTKVLDKKTLNKLIERTRNGGAEILELEKNSSAFFAPGSAVTQMVEAIIKDKHEILPCAAYLEGEYGLNGIFMGVPCKLGAKGMEKVIELNLSRQEERELKKSAESVRELISKLK